MQFDFTGTLNYLLSLGNRRLAIGRALLGYEGKGTYPVMVVEPDPLAAESSPGLLTYSFAFLVLDRERDEKGVYRKNPEKWPAVLATTGQWCDELVEMLRHEYPGDLKPGTYSRVALTEYSGEVATGWRCELQLQVKQPLNRVTNAALFDAAAPQPPESRPLNAWAPADILASYAALDALRTALGLESGPVATPAIPSTIPFRLK